MSPSFYEVIKTRLSQYDDFDNFPGQFYFTMILDTCNNSAAIDIGCSEHYFTNLSLNKFPGEKISDLDTDALRNIKIMRGAYALPPKLGTTPLLKVSKNSSDIFNRNILNYYYNNNKVETNYYLRDHRLMKNDNDYSKYGQVGDFGYLQNDYEKLFKNGCWTDITYIPVPEVNTATEKGTDDNGEPTRNDGRK